MVSFDRERFVYSLAGTLLACEWTGKALTAAINRAGAEHRIRPPKLAERILAAHPDKPSFARLSAMLLADAKLARSMSRPSWAGSLRWVKIARRPAMDDPPAGLRGIDIPTLATERELAEWFAIDIRRLRWRADRSGRNRRHPAGGLRTYRCRWIPRRGGLPRLLEIPRPLLKQMQRRILTGILNAVPVHPAVHGFCAGRSIVSNAAVHCGKATVLRFDLADFFPSVASARVFRIFRTLGYPPDVAGLLMGLCTTSMPADVWDARPGARDGADFLVRQQLVTRHLPQGAPTSPVLANLAAGRLDRRLAGLAAACGANYTRYADDLTFSGGDDLARARKRIETVVAVVAHEEGFALNHRKTRRMRAGVRQHVTGVVVNQRPNIGRAEFDRLKAILTNCVRHGPASQNRERVTDFRAHLRGKVAFITSVNPARGGKVLAIFRSIAWEGHEGAR